MEEHATELHAIGHVVHAMVQLSLIAQVVQRRSSFLAANALNNVPLEHLHTSKILLSAFHAQAIALRAIMQIHAKFAKAIISSYSEYVNSVANGLFFQT